MVLVMVGDIEMDKALKIVDKYITADKNVGKIECYEPSEPKERVQEYIEQKLSVSQPMFRIGFKETIPE